MGGVIVASGLRPAGLDFVQKRAIPSLGTSMPGGGQASWGASSSLQDFVRKRVIPFRGNPDEGARRGLTIGGRWPHGLSMSSVGFVRRRVDRLRQSGRGLLSAAGVALFFYHAYRAVRKTGAADEHGARGPRRASFENRPARGRGETERLESNPESPPREAHDGPEREPPFLDPDSRLEREAPSFLEPEARLERRPRHSRSMASRRSG
jgi:hypothetical protein